MTDAERKLLIAIAWCIRDIDWKLSNINTNRYLYHMGPSPIDELNEALTDIHDDSLNIPERE